MKNFEGSMVAIVTPFRDGKVDEKAFRALIDFQIAGGTSVIVPCGTTGEAATLSHEEHDRVIEICVEHVSKRVQVLAGAGSNSTSEAIRLTKFCEKVGVDGVLHITPYYNKPTQEGLLQHFQAIAKSTNLPIVLYNVPGRTGVNMLAETTIVLSKIENIVGIKEASASLVQATEIIKNTDKSFHLLSGEDALNYPLYAIGAKGAISVTCNLLPKKCAEQYEAIKKGDFEKALQIHNELFELNNVLFVETNPIPVKAALALMGHLNEEYRLPLVKISSKNREILKAVLQKNGILF